MVTLWDYTECSGNKVFLASNAEFQGEKNYYRVEWQTGVIPQTAINLLCDNYYFNISKKIKITIPNDPIFSGVYVFDYNSNKIVDATGIPGQWDFNEAESTTTLSKHPCSSGAAGSCSYYNNKYLISLDVINKPSSSGYVGYYEQTIIDNGSSRDAYAFPANIIMTAIQPTLDDTYVKGSIINNWTCGMVGFTGLPHPVGIGHRMVAAFKTPIRYRRPYNDWIVVDRIPITISGIAPNYASNLGADQVDISGLSPTNVEWSQLVDGLYESPYSNINSSGICVEVPYSGTAFKVSATGLGLTGGEGGAYAGVSSLMYHGLGRGNDFTDYPYSFGYWNGSTCVDAAGYFGGLGVSVSVPWSRWFGPKEPLVSTLQFVYSCRNDFSACTSGTPESYGTTTYSGCPYYGSNIIVDYLCNTNKPYPDDTDFTGVTNYSIQYSGVSGSYIGVSNSDYNNLTLYIPNNKDGSQLISIPYSGPSPTNISNIRSWIKNNVAIYDVDATSSNTGSIKFKYSYVDLFSNIDNTNALIKIILDDELTTYNILVSGAGTSNVNGVYDFVKTSNAYVKGDWQIRPVQKTLLTSGVFTNGYEWKIGSGLGCNWSPYYVLDNANQKPFFLPEGYWTPVNLGALPSGYSVANNPISI